MRVAIIQPMYQGHHLNHVRLLLESIGRTEGARAVLVTSEAATRSAQFATWVEPQLQAGGIEVDTSLPDPDSIDSRRTVASALSRLPRQQGLDHLVVPYGDGAVQHAAWLWLTGRLRLPVGCEAEALLFRGRFAYQTPKSLRERAWTVAWLAAVSAAPFARLHHLDPFILSWILERRPRQRSRWSLMPDPVKPLHAEMSRAEARRNLDLPVAGRLVGCAGALDERKGVPTLIEAFAMAAGASRLREQDRLLLVGEMDEKSRRSLERHRPLLEAGRIISRDRFVSDGEMEISLAAMDLVATLYPIHVGSASIIIRAAAHGRFVLGPQFGWMGRVIPALGLGQTVADASNATCVAAALPAALDAAETWQPGEAVQRFVEFHTEDNFQRQFTRRIRERLGLPPLPAREWETVVPGTGLS